MDKDNTPGKTEPTETTRHWLDPEHPEWYIYDSECLNDWYWEEFKKDWLDDSIFKNKGTPS